MDEALLSLGEEAMAKMGGRAAELQQLIESNFSAVPLASVEAEFSKALAKAPTVVNDKVAKLGALVREQAALTIEDLKAAEMWLILKTPEVSDGNNFGVDVQEFVYKQLKELKAEAAVMLDAVGAYHAARAAVVEKVVKVPSKTVDEESKTETDDGKTVKKSSKVEKTSTAVATPLPDYVAQVAAIDTKEYHACYGKLVDLRNTYIKAGLVLVKNKKRLADPRGDGEGTRSNVMTMF